ncbi:hypothetical protein C4546_02780 [Candidatus Parcubacteria bacterium]|jgi:hypothetical protein|nr:MAG: hypothetical protein C4546_02780 [Candidatus Parcubacteria bacterium]
MFKRLIKHFLFFSLILVWLAPNSAFAAFNPGRIISDEEFTDANSLSVGDIQNFLVRRGGVLANRTLEDFNKVSKTVSEAILEIGKLYNINPKVILVTLQKEQSLLSDPTPTQRQFDYAMGYGCPDSGGCSANAKGFYRQMDFAAWQFRRYLDFPSQFTYQVGRSYTFSDLNNSRKTTVTIENQATAGLYNYTPHVYNGNFNFYNFYTTWFAKHYPDGSLVRAKNTGGVWLIQNGEKRAIQNRTAFMTRFGDFSKVLEITQDELENYARGPDIKLPNYSLVRTPDLAIYLISGDEKRLIQSQEVFRNLGFNPEEVIDVSFEDVAAYLDGFQISNSSAYPAGALVRIRENGAITWIENGVWYPIVDRAILKSRFPNRKPSLTISNSELDQYTKGPALKLRDGELVRVKGEGAVYVISNGLRRGITSRQMLNQFGYKIKNVLVISPRLAEEHPVGEKLNNVNL